MFYNLFLIFSFFGISGLRPYFQHQNIYLKWLKWTAKRQNFIKVWVGYFSIYKSPLRESKYFFWQHFHFIIFSSLLSFSTILVVSYFLFLTFVANKTLCIQLVRKFFLKNFAKFYYNKLRNSPKVLNNCLTNKKWAHVAIF